MAKITKHGADHIRAEISRLQGELLNSKNLYMVDREDTEDIGFRYNPVAVDIEERRQAIHKQISAYHKQLSDAEIVDDEPSSEFVVGLHDIVEIVCDYGADQESMVVYLKELDLEEDVPGVRSITCSAPIGKAILNHEVGETVIAMLPNKRTCNVTINSIEKALNR